MRNLFGYFFCRKSNWRRWESNPRPKWIKANLYECRFCFSRQNPSKISLVSFDKAFLSVAHFEKNLDTLNSHPRTASCIIVPIHRQDGQIERLSLLLGSYCFNSCSSCSYRSEASFSVYSVISTYVFAR